MFGTVVAADCCTTDFIFRLDRYDRAATAKIESLIALNELKLGDKFKPTTWDEYHTYFKATAAMTPMAQPGGSSANVARTLKGLFGDRLNVRFFTYLGHGSYAPAIRLSFKDAGVELFEHAMPETAATRAPQHTPQSIVIVPRGENDRIIINWEGKEACSILGNANLPVGFGGGARAFLLQGAAIKKMGEDFFNRFAAARPAKAELWLTLPTDEKAGRAYSAFFQAAAAKAHVLSANLEEFIAVYHKGLQPGLKELAEAWLASPDNNFALITDGANPVHVVSGGTHAIRRINPLIVQAVNRLGTGDTGLAFACAGRVLGFNADECAEMLVIGGGAKAAENNGAVLINPRAALATYGGALGQRALALVAA